MHTLFVHTFLTSRILQYPLTYFSLPVLSSSLRLTVILMTILLMSLDGELVNSPAERIRIVKYALFHIYTAHTLSYMETCIALLSYGSVVI